MNFSLPKGKYVIAVSGGVDSVALLDMLATGGYDNEFVVAHFDHGIRLQSQQDAIFVEALAKKYNLPFVTERVELGSDASENRARVARYDFLRRVCKSTAAQAIITAHHQDDLLETLLLHVQRGTGRAGLTPMQSEDVLRPLLYTTKKDIEHYASSHSLTWHDDPTNTNQKYERNKIRALLAKASPKLKADLLAIHQNMLQVNADIDEQLQLVYAYTTANGCIIRACFVQLPFAVQSEVVYAWLKNNAIQNISKQLVRRVVIACKTYLPGKKMSLTKSTEIHSQQKLIKILQK